jgi:hypothetical protein
MPETPGPSNFTWFAMAESKAREDVFLTLLGLCAFADNMTGEAFPGDVAIARSCHQGPFTVHLNLEKLLAMGEIALLPERARHNKRTYRVLLGPNAPDAKPADWDPDHLAKPSKPPEETPEPQALDTETHRKAPIGITLPLRLTLPQATAVEECQDELPGHPPQAQALYDALGPEAVSDMVTRLYRQGTIAILIKEDLTVEDITA